MLEFIPRDLQIAEADQAQYLFLNTYLDWRGKHEIVLKTSNNQNCHILIFFFLYIYIYIFCVKYLILESKAIALKERSYK